MNGYGSPARSIDWEDVYKGIKAFFWNLVSLAIAITGFLLTLDPNEVPSWMWALLAAAPLVNGISVVALRWYQNNHK